MEKRPFFRAAMAGLGSKGLKRSFLAFLRRGLEKVLYCIKAEIE